MPAGSTAYRWPSSWRPAGVGTFGLRETAAQLNSKLELLWEGKRTAPPRHQTLGATLDWSYHLLGDSEQTVLRKLSAFVGSFSLEAARSVGSSTDAGEGRVIAVLASLVEKSLVAVDASGPATAYRLLDTTRVYALGKLIDSGDAEQTSLRHAVYFLRLLETTGACPSSKPDGKVFSNFVPHLGNVRAALEWSFRRPESVGLALTLSAASARMFMELSLLTECCRWTERALARLDETTRGTGLEIELQAALGFSSIFTIGNSERAKLALQRSLALATQSRKLERKPCTVAFWTFIRRKVAKRHRHRCPRALLSSAPPERFSEACKDHQPERDKSPEECWPFRQECHPPHRGHWQTRQTGLRRRLHPAPSPLSGWLGGSLDVIPCNPRRLRQMPRSNPVAQFLLRRDWP